MQKMIIEKASQTEKQNPIAQGKLLDKVHTGLEVLSQKINRLQNYVYQKQQDQNKIKKKLKMRRPSILVAKVFGCNICEKIYGSSSSCKQHIKRKHPDENPSDTCRDFIQQKNALCFVDGDKIYQNLSLASKMYVDEEKQRQKFLQNEVKEIDFCKKPSEKEESDSFWQPDKNNSEKSLPSQFYAKEYMEFEF